MSVVPIIIKTEEENAELKPLYKLMEKLLDEDENTDETLISRDNLTAILKTDFSINLDGLASGQIECYMNVLKWSLKGWPGWENVTNDEKEPKRTKIDKERVLREYFSVKKYIGLRLRITRRCIAAIEQKNNSEREITKIKKKDKLVLKVECSKKQLKHLINSRISRKLKLVNFIQPKTTGDETNKYQWMSFMDIFNWPFLEVYIDLPNFSFVHKNVSKSSYRVVNWKNNSDPVEQIDREVYCKNLTNKKYGLKLEFVLDYLEQVKKFVADGSRISNAKKTDITGLFEEIVKDISILKDHITIGTEYKFNVADYNFVQYLCNNVNHSTIENDDLYKKYPNLQPRLQHTLTPAMSFCLGRFSCTYWSDASDKRFFKLGLEVMERVNNNWLRIHCALCDESMTGFLSFHELNNHLAEHHGAENEWSCVKCKKSFSVLELAYRRWRHSCT